MRPIVILASCALACAAEQPHTVTLAEETPHAVATIDAFHRRARRNDGRGARA